MSKKFEPVRRSKNTKDERGNVKISIMLVEHGKSNAKKGNITRTVTVKNAKVSELFEAIQDKLIEG